MPLTPGSRIGAYEIVAIVGAGGMGEVYRARDATLHRDVALKILPEPFAIDEERLMRLMREVDLIRIGGRVSYVDRRSFSASNTGQ